MNALLVAGAVTFAAVPDTLTGLPLPENVFVIAVSPHPKEIRDYYYFTPDSLLKALPKLVPADVQIPGHATRFWQYGVIVLKDKTVLFWRTCGDWFIAIDSPTGTTFYAFAKKDTPNKVSEPSVAPAPQVQH